MERYAWKATVLPGMLEEYIRRHDNIWPEMKEVLSAAGIRNYTIWRFCYETIPAPIGPSCGRAVCRIRSFARMRLRYTG